MSQGSLLDDPRRGPWCSTYKKKENEEGVMAEAKEVIANQSNKEEEQVHIDNASGKKYQ